MPGLLRQHRVYTRQCYHRLDYGTACGTAQGSCLNLAASSPSASMSYVAIFWARPIVAVFGSGRGHVQVSSGGAEVCYLDAVGELEVLFGDSTSGNSSDCSLARCFCRLHYWPCRRTSRGRSNQRGWVWGTCQWSSCCRLLGRWSSFMTSMPIGVPYVTPISVPDCIMSRSFSFRGVVMALYPGRPRGHLWLIIRLGQVQARGTSVDNVAD